MATTNARLAAAVLDSLEQSGLEFAVLHGEREITAGNVVSDVDVVVGIHPLFALERATAFLESEGVYPIMVWNYDVGETATVFLATQDASDGVQLDLMFDPDGRGKYGAKTIPMLASRVRGERWPTVDVEHQVAYLIRKRHVKNDMERLSELLLEARRFPFAEFSELVRETFSRRVARSILNLVANRESVSRVPFPAWYRVRNAWRRAKRVFRPTGFWVEITGESATETASGVAQRFGRFLPVVAVSVRPVGGLALAGWILSTVVPVRWRAGLLVSSGSEWQRSMGDCVLHQGTPAELCRTLVEAMRQEVKR